MKKLLLIAVVGLSTLAGCSNSKIDTDRLQGAFKSAEGDTKAQLEQGIAAIKATNYTAALDPLQKVAYGSKMTKEQKEIITDAIDKVRVNIKKSEK